MPLAHIRQCRGEYRPVKFSWKWGKQLLLPCLGGDRLLVGASRDSAEERIRMLFFIQRLLQ